MKKIVIMTAALLALAAAAFAKAPKVKGWKDVAKIAGKQGMEVVSDYTDRYVAKKNGGKNFVFYAEKKYADMTVTLAMTCVDGDVFSSCTMLLKSDGAPVKFGMEEQEKKARLVDAGGQGIYFDDAATFLNTTALMEERALLRADVVKEAGLVLPEKTRKNDAAYLSAYEANRKNLDDISVLKKLIDINFAN